ncbi:MAG: formylglycine-generating enzyme family protein [Treponema sp.]|nr:formylglycine-generating enzyme family protein [Treponema sp.]
MTHKKSALLWGALCTSLLLAAGCRTSDDDEEDSPRPSPSQTETVTKVGEFVYIPAGSFRMGSEKGSGRGPVHTVTLTRSYWICEHEVTQKEYKSVMGALTTKLTELAESSRGGYGDDYPMNCVHWFHELEYCNRRSIKEGYTPCYTVNGSTNPASWPAYSEWTTYSCNFTANGYRLPTSAEWEYAARAGDTTTDVLSYSGTTDISELNDYAWWGENSVSAPGAYDASAKEVMTRKPNAWGIYDMSGNVRERVWDLMNGWGYTEADEGAVDPTGPEESSYGATLIRGGAFNDYNGTQCATADYFYQPFGSWLEWDGFRVVRTATSATETAPVVQPEQSPDGFVKITAGTFYMGCSAERKNSKDKVLATNDKAVHPVTLTRDFYMSDHETTQAEWYATVGSYPENLTPGAVAAQKPIIFVSLYSAAAYCNARSLAEGLTPCYSVEGKESQDPATWGDAPAKSSEAQWTISCNFDADGYRLPTEAEWEYAARAGNSVTDAYTWSGTETEADAAEYLWYGANAEKTLHEVKTKKPNAWGLYDMSGNARELCWDVYEASFSEDAVIDPTGTTSDDFSVSKWHVVRDGGNVTTDSADTGLLLPFFSVSARTKNQIFSGTAYLGFRVVRTIR